LKVVSGDLTRHPTNQNMPLRRRNQITNPHVFFLTTSTYQHTPFPDQPASFKTIEEILFDTVIDSKMILHAYVIMPTHFHLIIGSPKGGPGVSKFMHSLKGRVREVLQGKGKFWQDRFDDLVLITEKQFRIKLNYVHQNPVRAGLVRNPEDWPYSSYKDWLNLDTSRGIEFTFEKVFGLSGEVTRQHPDNATTTKPMKFRNK
jgi:putative transposase